MSSGDDEKNLGQVWFRNDGVLFVYFIFVVCVYTEEFGSGQDGLSGHGLTSGGQDGLLER